MWWTHSATIITSLWIIEIKVSLQLWANQDKKRWRDRIILAFWKNQGNLGSKIQNCIFQAIQQLMK